MATCTNDTPCGNPGDGHYHSAVCLRVAAQRFAGMHLRLDVLPLPAKRYVHAVVTVKPGSPLSAPDVALRLREGDSPERSGRAGDQPLPTPGSQSVFAEVRRRLDEREATGVRRYGRSLETFNGRDACLDLEEELLDGLAYVTQLRLEHAAVVDALVTLARTLRPVTCLGRAYTQIEQDALDLAAKLDRRPR